MVDFAMETDFKLYFSMWLVNVIHETNNTNILFWSFFYIFHHGFIDLFSIDIVLAQIQLSRFIL